MTRCRFDEDVAPWVLGALDDGNAAQFTVHLRSCPSCSEAVAELRGVVDQMPIAVPQVAPRPELKAAVMDAVRSDPRAVAAPAPRRRRRRRWSLSPVPAGALATALLALGVTGGLLVRGGDDGDSSTTRTVAGTTVYGAKAQLEVGDDGAATLVLDRMPPAPGGRVYQVWIARGKAAPQPTHTLFTVRDDGRARVRIDERVRAGERVLVTAEPHGGSIVPSSTPVVAAPV